MFGQPEVFVSLHNPTGLRLFGYRMPPSNVTAPDIGRFGTILDVGNLEFNSAAVTGDLFGGILATERPQVRIVFRNEENQWGLWAGQEVVLHQAMGIHLWYGDTHLFQDFMGEIVNFDPTKDECMVEVGEGRLLYEMTKLARAEIYPRPKNPAALLPVVYGDFVSPGVNSPSEDAGGMTPCPCIDRDNNVFLVSDSRCFQAPGQFWINDTLQQEFTSSGARVYTYVPDEDYAGLGRRIAYVQFHGVVSGEVSCRVMGTIDDLNGLMISEPIHAIAHFLISKAGWTINDFDPFTHPQAQVAMQGRNYTVHWCFNADKTPKEWLAEYFKHYWVDTLITADAKLAFLVDQVPTPPERVLAFVDARDDLGGDEPERGVQCNIDARNLVNSVTVKGRARWTDMQSTGELTLKDEASIRLHQRTKEYLAELPGVRTTEHASSWIGQLNGRTTFLPTAIRLTLRHLRYPFLMPGTYMGFSWRQAPSGVVGGWSKDRPAIMKIRNASRQYPNPYTGRSAEMQLDAIFTGQLYRRSTYSRMVDNFGTLHHVYVNEAGTLSTDPGIPAMDALNATPWRWISRQAPNSTTYYLHLERNADGSGLHMEISDASPGGAGSSDATLEWVNRFYQGYRIRVSDPPIPQIIVTTF